MLTVAVSPYHLTTQEIPALAALLLAEHVVTLLPVPAAGTSRSDIADAVERSPRYLRFMESWRWSMPLWQGGVISSGHQHEEISSELSRLYGRINLDESLALLRPLMRSQASASPHQFLDHVSADILKGGPDPACNIPISAAIDAFAVRHSLPVARSAASSVAQRAEARLGRRAFSLALPVVLRASGRRMLVLRRRLSPELEPLRERIDFASSLARQTDRHDGADSAGISAAARDYTRAFDAAGSLTSGDDDEGRRVTRGYVSITALSLPADVVLRSSIAALRTVNWTAPPPSEHHAPPAPSPSPARLIVLVVKQMSVRPDAPSLD